jgi:hypothetical protein
MIGIFEYVDEPLGFLRNREPEQLLNQNVAVESLPFLLVV